jgi:tRNA (cmo5U34)-methyltransferase
MKDHIVNDFNGIASVYDALASMVFGKNLIKSQHHFLHVIPDYATVLIVGGGSGELLQTLLQQKPKCQVVYVDASERMIELARQRVQNAARVTFLCGTESVEMPVPAFTVVITNFYLSSVPTASTCPVTKCPPSRSPARRDRSRFTRLPGTSRPNVVRRSVSSPA